MTDQEKTKLLKLISDGRIQQAIDKVLAVKRNKSLHKEALTIASRYNRLKRSTRLGVLSFEQLTITENQIAEHLIDVINRPENEPFPIENSIYTTHATRPVIWKYIVTFIIVIGILMSLAEAFEITNFIPSKAPLQLTIFVKDSHDNFVLKSKGTINITLGNRPLSKVIGEDGRVHFSEIPSIRKGDTIHIGLEAEDWEIAGKSTFVFTGDPITLKVKRDHHLGTIKGRVMSRDGQKFIRRAKIIVKDTVVYTDANGYFEILLPEKMWIATPTGTYKVTISHPDYIIKKDYYSPKSSDAEIRLDKK